MRDKDTFIDQFFNKELNQQELEEFQQMLDTDEEFRGEVQLRMALQKAVAQKEATERIQKDAIKRRLKELSTESAQSAVDEKKPEAKVRNIGRWLTAIAAIGILLIIGYIGFNDAQSGGQNLTADFYNNNYAPYDADITLKSIPSNTLIAELDKAYKSKDYNASISLTDSILNEIPQDAEILLIKGIALLEKDRLDEALAIFDSISNDLYKDEVNWYAAMVLLKQNKVTDAKLRLQQIKGNKYLKKLESINLE